MSAREALADSRRYFKELKEMGISAEVIQTEKQLFNLCLAARLERGDLSPVSPETVAQDTDIDFLATYKSLQYTRVVGLLCAQQAVKRYGMPSAQALREYGVPANKVPSSLEAQSELRFAYNQFSPNAPTWFPKIHKSEIARERKTRVISQNSTKSDDSPVSGAVNFEYRTQRSFWMENLNAPNPAVQIDYSPRELRRQGKSKKSSSSSSKDIEVDDPVHFRKKLRKASEPSFSLPSSSESSHGVGKRERQMNRPPHETGERSSTRGASIQEVQQTHSEPRSSKQQSSEQTSSKQQSGSSKSRQVHPDETLAQDLVSKDVPFKQPFLRTEPERSDSIESNELARSDSTGSDEYVPPATPEDPAMMEFTEDLRWVAQAACKSEEARTCVEKESACQRCGPTCVKSLYDWSLDAYKGSKCLVFTNQIAEELWFHDWIAKDAGWARMTQFAPEPIPRDGCDHQIPRDFSHDFPYCAVCNGCHETEYKKVYKSNFVFVNHFEAKAAGFSPHHPPLESTEFFNTPVCLSGTCLPQQLPDRIQTWKIKDAARLPEQKIQEQWSMIPRLGHSLEIRPKDASNGVFVSRSFRKGEVVSVFAGHRFQSLSLAALVNCSGHSEIKRVDGEAEFVDALEFPVPIIGCGVAQSVKAGPGGNVEYRVAQIDSRKEIYIRAVRYISAGEELFLAAR